MKPTLNRLLVLLLALASIALGCSADVVEVSPPQAGGLQHLATIRVRISPKSRTMRIITDDPADTAKASSPGLGTQNLTSPTIVSDGVDGSGPAGTVELVTVASTVADTFGTGPVTDADGNTCAGDSFCAKVKLRHFLGVDVNNALVAVVAVRDPTTHALLSGHGATNGDSSPWLVGITAPEGQWRHNANGAAYPAGSGQMGAAAPKNVGARYWQFGNPDDADTEIELAVWASVSYASYSMTATTESVVGWIDACTASGATVFTGTAGVGTHSISLPWNYTLWGNGDTPDGFGTNSVVEFNDVGVASLGTIVLPDGANTKLPKKTSPRPLIAAFWDTIAPQPTSKLCAAVVGTKLVIVWSDYKFAGNANNKTHLTFALQIEQGTDKFWTVYHTMTANNQARADGNAATVGTQDSTGTRAAGGVVGGNSTASGVAYAFVPTP